MKTAILGGGLTGLTLANFLKNDFIVFEKNKECGGLCRSISKDGFTFDFGGSHIIFSKDGGVLDFMVKSLKNNVVRCRRNTKIFFKKRYVKYPFENGLSDLPKEDNYECLLTFFENIIKKEKGMLKKPVNFKEWMYYTFGKGIAEKYLIPYNEKIWNTKAENMNLGWIEGRIPQPPIQDIIKSSIGIETEGYTHQLYFYYPKSGGIQALIKSLEKKISKRIRTGFEIKKVKKKNQKFFLSDGKEELVFDRIISTIPLPELINAVDAPKDVIKAANNLKYNSLIAVMIGLSNKKLNDISWMYFPDNKDGLFNRVGFPFNFSNNTVPKGNSSLIAEITCSYDDKVWKKKDEEIINHVVDNLDKNGIINKKNVCFSLVKRLKYAYVIYDLDYKRNTKTVKAFLKYYGIDIVGRFSEWEYINMDKCIRNAINFAKNF